MNHKVEYRAVACDCGFVVSVPAQDKQEWRLIHTRLNGPLMDVVHVLQLFGHFGWTGKFLQRNNEDGSVTSPPEWLSLDDVLISENDDEFLGWNAPILMSQSESSDAVARR